MCNLGQAIYNEAHDSGIQLGLQQGELNSIVKLAIKKISTGLSALEALIDLGIDECDIDKYLKVLKERGYN